MELLGEPMDSYFLVVQSDGSSEVLSKLPANGLPADVSYREILEYSANRYPKGNYRAVRIVLDKSGRVESTRDFITSDRDEF